MRAITSGSCCKTPKSFVTKMETSSSSAARRRTAQQQWPGALPVRFYSHHWLWEPSHTVTTDFEACRPQLFSPTLQESRTAKLRTSEQLPSVGLIVWRLPLRWRSPWRKLTTERFGLARNIKGFSISRKAAFPAYRMGGLIRSLTAFFLFKTQNCGSERRRVCCAGVEQSLLWQVYRHLCTISTYFPFFATGTRISGLARVADCFGTTQAGFLY